MEFYLNPLKETEMIAVSHYDSLIVESRYVNERQQFISHLSDNKYDKMKIIIQWNCRCLNINSIVNTLLVHTILPIAFCLPESHVKSDNLIYIIPLTAFL